MLSENSVFTGLLTNNMQLMLLRNIIDFSCIVSWPPGQDSQLMNIPKLFLQFIWLTILLQESK